MRIKASEDAALKLRAFQNSKPAGHRQLSAACPQLQPAAHLSKFSNTLSMPHAVTAPIRTLFGSFLQGSRQPSWMSLPSGGPSGKATATALPTMANNCNRGDHSGTFVSAAGARCWLQESHRLGPSSGNCQRLQEQSFTAYCSRVRQATYICCLVDSLCMDRNVLGGPSGSRGAAKVRGEGAADIGGSHRIGFIITRLCRLH